MRKHHPKNERVKRRYLTWLEDAKRLSPHSVDQATAAIAAFEVSTNYKDFAAFHIEQARRFKRQLSETPNSDTGRLLAKATIHSRLMAVKGFLQWLAREPGYRARLNYSDAEYFNPSANDTRIATTRREAPSPELAQIHGVLEAMPAETVIEKRDRAVIAFTTLTGARDGAIASLSLRHVDLDQRVVHQDARDVHTKFRKSFPTWFFRGRARRGDCARLDQPPENRNALRAGRSALPANASWSRRRRAVCAGRTAAHPLEECRCRPEDIPRGVHGRRAASVPSPFVPEDPCAPRTRALRDAGRVQVVVAKSRP